MAKKKKTEDLATGGELDLTKLANAVGGEILSRMDSVKFWIDTGNLALNYGCSGKFIGGGIPSGKIIEIWGNSSSCKTLFALNFLRGVQQLNGIAVFIDVENTINSTFAEKAAHVDTDSVIVIPVGKVDSLEKVFNQIHVILREISKVHGNERPVVIIYDSIAASASEREFAETTIDMFNSTKEAVKAAGAGADMPGQAAKIIGKELKKLNPVLNKANASVIVINQIREKIGVMFGNPEKKATGGRSLEYYCSLSMKTKASMKLTDDRENIRGILVSVENTKNKCYRPFVKAPIDAQLLFDVGINPLGGLLDCLYKEYRIDKGEKAGYWKVNPIYSNGEEITFKAAVGKNIVPMDILFKCPKLLDVEHEDQVRDYLSKFGILEEANFQEQEIKSGEELDAEISG